MTTSLTRGKSRCASANAEVSAIVLDEFTSGIFRRLASRWHSGSSLRVKLVVMSATLEAVPSWTI